MTGISFVRSSSSGACSESASLTCIDSSASLSMPGIQPAVEIAIWRAPRPKPSGELIERIAASTLS